MGSNYVVSTSRDGLSVEQVGGNDVYQMLPQLQSVLDGLGPQYRQLFAEPVENRRHIDWYVESSGKAVPLASLPSEERQAILKDLKGVLENLNAYSDRLRAADNPASRAYADILAKAITLPKGDALSHIYVADGKPVLTGWGFTDGLQDEMDGVKALIKVVDTSIEKEKPEPAPQPEPAPEPAPVTPEPAPVQPALVAPAPASSSKGWLLAVLIGGLLVLAGLAAAWYFFYYKPGQETLPSAAKPAQAPPASSNPDMGFLRDGFNIPGKLVDSAGKSMELELTFPDGSGKGTAYARGEDQVCQGPVSANLAGAATVVFDVSALSCPNQDDYESMTIVWNRDSGVCAITYKDGKTYNVNLKE